MGLATASDCSRFFPNRVAIVGGGFAGLAAAWTLGHFGISSMIFEARSTYGGRVETNKILIPGRLIETGAELIGFNHPMWLALARNFHLGLTVLTGEDQYAAAGLEPQFRLRGKAIADPEKLYEQMAVVFQKISDDARVVTDPFAPWTARGASALDAKSVAEKIAEYARLVPGPRHPLLVDAIEFELGNDHVLPAKKQSYLGLLAVVSGGRLGKDDVHLEGYWTHREDFRCAEGNASLGVNMLEHGKPVEFHISSPVKKIEIGETDPPVKVTWLDPIQGLLSRNFDAVILAVPPSVWHKITIKPPLPSGREMGLGPAVKYISHVNGRFWIRRGMAPSAVSDELGQTWEATENQALASRGIALTVFAGGPFVPKTDAKRHFQSEILKLYPDYTVTNDHYADWPNTEWIETGYACPKVGQVTTIGKFLSVPHAKRLYFAGEHTCMAYFGYMEGALQSGARAAKALVSSCFRKPGAVVAEEEVLVSAGSRRESETSFLHELLRDLGHDPVPGLSPVALFRAALQNRPLISNGPELLRVVALPSQQPRDSLRAGDWMLRAVPGSGDIGHVSVLASGNLLTQSMLASEGIPSESVQPGYYGLVIEGGAFPHNESQPFARKLLSGRGCVPPNTVFVRPTSRNGDSPVPTEDVAEDLTYDEILDRIKHELNIPFSDRNDPGLLQRRQRLRELFTSVPAPRTRELHDRLGARPTGDALSELFHYRLASAERREMLKILEDRFPAVTPPAPTPTRPTATTTTSSACRRPMGSMKPLRRWERAFLAMVHDRSESDFESVGIFVGPIILPGVMTYPMDAIVRLALKQGNAITIDNNIWFPTAIDTSTVSDLMWLVHESVHVMDYAVAGTEAFLKTYIQQAIVHGFRHDDIPHEVRANQLAAAAKAMLDRSPDLARAIASCDSDAIMTLVKNNRDTYRAALHESIHEADSFSEDKRPDPGRIYNFVRNLLKLPSTDVGGVKKDHAAKILDTLQAPDSSSPGDQRDAAVTHAVLAASDSGEPFTVEHATADGSTSVTLSKGGGAKPVVVPTWAENIEPFPPKPVVDFAPNDADMKAAFATVAANNPTNLCAALVDLTGAPAKPPYAGLNDQDMLYVGSMGKICAMYAAFALRSRVQAFVDAADKKGASTTAADLFPIIAAAWRPKLKGLFKTRPEKPFNLSQDIVVPQLNSIFDVSGKIVTFKSDSKVTMDQIDDHGNVDADGNHTAEFMALGRFNEWLIASTRWSSNLATSRVVDALGFFYMNGALADAEFFKAIDPTNGTGLWLSADYQGHDWVKTAADKTANAAGPKLTKRWADIQLDEGRKRVRGNIVATAFETARFMTLMAQDKLVDLDASKAMRVLLANSLDGIGSYIKDAFDGAGIIVASMSPKKGFGNDKFSHECAIVERTIGAKHLRYVLVGLGSAKNQGRADLSALFVQLDAAIVASNP